MPAAIAKKRPVEKALTQKQLDRLIKDRADEFVAIVCPHLGINEVSEKLFTEICGFVEDLYHADKAND